MGISLKNFKQNITVAILTKSKKGVVRECDETGKGNFVAFVDEDANSFDVSIEVNAKGEILNHLCDCDLKTPICQHKIALISFLANNESIKKTVVVKKKKQTELEVLLDEISFQDLTDWVKAVLPKNKDLEMAFINHFANKNKIYTPQEVQKVTLDAIKAINKSKSKIEQSELKRILELWKEVHKPIVEAYFANVTIHENFLNFHALIESVMDYNIKP